MTVMLQAASLATGITSVLLRKEGRKERGVDELEQGSGGGGGNSRSGSRSRSRIVVVV